MSYIQTALWGFVEAMSSVLPISDSAHLAIFEKLFGLTDIQTQHGLFYAMLDFSMFLVIVISYRHEIQVLFRALHSMTAKRSPKKSTGKAERRLFLFVLIGLFPLILDLILAQWAKDLWNNCLFWSILLILGGLILFLCNRFPKGTKDEKQMRIGDSLLIGLGQAVSVLPGFSRTGLTIAIGQSQGLKPTFAMQYSFLLAIPFLLGSSLIQLIRALKIGVTISMLPAYFVGMLVCVVAGFAALQVLRLMIYRNRLSVFSYYCWGAAAFSLFLFLIT